MGSLVVGASVAVVSTVRLDMMVEMNTRRRLTVPFYAQRPSVPLVLLTFFLLDANAFLIPYPAAPLTAPKAAALLAAMAAGAKSARSGKRPPR